MMYIAPSWIELMISGFIVKIMPCVIAILISILIFKFLFEHYEKKHFSLNNLREISDSSIIKVPVITIILFIVLLVGASLLSGYIWNITYEQPSIQSDVITVSAIQPRPGAVEITDNGYNIDNSNQLLFVTTDGREFCNLENMYMNKFETRSLFNQLRVNGTYNITYYGWRNGHSNEFPNILSVKVIDENNTQPTDWNKYFGHHYGNRYYDVESEKDLNQI